MTQGKVKIDGTKFGEITINGKPYDSDMTVYWDGRLAYRGKDHIIELGEFMKILKSEPEILVIGAGQNGIVKVSEVVAEWAKNKKVDIYSEATPKAIDIFNAFVSQGKKAVGIFHVTC